MKLKFMREFDGDLEKLPKREVEGAVQFREFDSMKKLAVVANVLGGVLMIILMIPLFNPLFTAAAHNDPFYFARNMLILVAVYLASVPIHELLHANCFREEVYFFTYLKKGMAFVVGTESMSKARFVFMSILPNIVFGFIPYIAYFAFGLPVWFGFFGAIAIGSGAGDYINIYNALRQVPKGGLCYMSGMHSYWYMPDNLGEK